MSRLLPLHAKVRVTGTFP